MRESDFYFGFEWIVGELAVYFALRDTAAKCGCEIVELKPAPYKRDGFDVLPFVIRASPATNLEQFRNMIGEDRVLDWKPSSKAVFKTGKPPTTQEQLAAIPGEFPMRWLDSFKASARHNQTLKANRPQRGEPSSDAPSTDGPPSV